MSRCVYFVLFAAILMSLNSLTGCKPDETQVAGQENQANEQKPVEVFPAQKAKAALCKVGSKLREHNDAQKIITGAASTLLDVKAGTVLEISVPQAIQFFKAEKGRFPKNHQEFLTMVCEPNNIKLPELIDGMVYQFNPELGELWAYPKDEVPVEKP